MEEERGARESDDNMFSPRHSQDSNDGLSGDEKKGKSPEIMGFIDLGFFTDTSLLIFIRDFSFDFISTI